VSNSIGHNSEKLAQVLGAARGNRVAAVSQIRVQDNSRCRFELSVFFLLLGTFLHLVICISAGQEVLGGVGELVESILVTC
jgi:hypothetical protein